MSNVHGISYYTILDIYIYLLQLYYYYTGYIYLLQHEAIPNN